jgi:hypothetical protein
MKPTNSTPPTQHDAQQPTDEGLGDAIAELRRKYEDAYLVIDEVMRERDEARGIAFDACLMLSSNGFETNYPPMPWNNSAKTPSSGIAAVQVGR